MVAVAFGLRLFRIGEPSLWYDEAVSALFARSDLAGLLASAASDNHPPFYFVLLQIAVSLTGSGEFALRFPSAIAGTLLVPLVYRLARDCDARRGPLAGLIAGWLIAVSPFAVRYAQEARMYAALAALSILACLLFLRALRRGGWAWFGYGAVTTLAIYTHYYAALLVAAQAAGLIVWLALARRRRLAVSACWLLCQGAVVALYLPWLETLRVRFVGDASYWPGTLDFEAFVWQTAMSFSGAEWLPQHLADLAIALTAGAALLGVLAVRGPERRIGLVLALLVVGPVVGLYLLTAQRPKFHQRYLIEVQPVFLVAIGVGTAAVASWRMLPRALGVALGGAVLIGLSALSVAGLFRLYFDPAYARDDFRSVVAYVEQHAQPDDGILVVGGHAGVAVAYYLRRDLPIYGLPPGPFLDLSRQLDTTVGADLEPIAKRHRRLWVVLWQDQPVDPTQEVLRQLQANLRREEVGRWFQGVHLQLYQRDGPVSFEREASAPKRRPARFVDGIGLLGYDLKQEAVRQGEAIDLVLFWQAERRLDEDLTAFVHLLNRTNRVYGQVDRGAGGDGFGTSRWTPGRTVRDAFQIPVPPGTPPGRYTIEIGLYRPGTGARLSVEGTNADHVLVTEIDVERRRDGPAEPAGPRPRLGPLLLLGHELERERFRVGEEMRVRLLWQVVTPSATPTIALRLIGPAGATVEHRQVLLEGLYPADRWVEGELLREVVPITLPGDLAPGSYRLELALGSRQPDEGWIDLGSPLTIAK